MVCVLKPCVSCDDSRAFPVFSVYQRTALALPIWSALTSRAAAFGNVAGRTGSRARMGRFHHRSLLVIVSDVIDVFIFTGGQEMMKTKQKCTISIFSIEAPLWTTE